MFGLLGDKNTISRHSIRNINNITVIRFCGCSCQCHHSYRLRNNAVKIPQMQKLPRKHPQWASSTMNCTCITLQHTPRHVALTLGSYIVHNSCKYSLIFCFYLHLMASFTNIDGTHVSRGHLLHLIFHRCDEKTDNWPLGDWCRAPQKVTCFGSTRTHSDFPLPVGMLTDTSFSLRKYSTTCTWCSLSS